VSTYVRNHAEATCPKPTCWAASGANLPEMSRLGLPVPSGFTITTEACRSYLRDGTSPAGLEHEVSQQLSRLESDMGRTLGDGTDPAGLGAFGVEGSRCPA
jgi:pyruvate,orthophosphate dikinase